MDADAKRKKPIALEPLSAYATTFRYSLSPTPKLETLQGMLVILSGLYNLARAELLAVQVRYQVQREQASS